jgi:hypothetical protein
VKDKCRGRIRFSSFTISLEKEQTSTFAGRENEIRKLNGISNRESSAQRTASQLTKDPRVIMSNLERLLWWQVPDRRTLSRGLRQSDGKTWTRLTIGPGASHFILSHETVQGSFNKRDLYLGKTGENKLVLLPNDIFGEFSRDGASLYFSDGGKEISSLAVARLFE